jgi:hypothetical protein
MTEPAQPTKPNAFIDLHPDMYPFTMYYVNHLTGEIVDSERVEGPGVIGIQGNHDVPIGVYISYPAGVQYAPPPGYEGEGLPRQAQRKFHIDAITRRHFGTGRA